jgi:hypothetical protein
MLRVGTLVTVGCQRDRYVEGGMLKCEEESPLWVGSQTVKPARPRAHKARVRNRILTVVVSEEIGRCCSAGVEWALESRVCGGRERMRL